MIEKKAQDYKPGSVFIFLSKDGDDHSSGIYVSINLKRPYPEAMVEQT
jgi:hypothetical protein